MLFLEAVQLFRKWGFFVKNTVTRPTSAPLQYQFCGLPSRLPSIDNLLFMEGYDWPAWVVVLRCGSGYTREVGS